MAKKPEQKTQEETKKEPEEEPAEQSDNISEADKNPVEQIPLSEFPELIEEPPRKPIIITDVKPYEYYNPSETAAWFETPNGTRSSKVPSFYGLFHSEDETIPVLLYIAGDGVILPPFMIEGFIGIFPADHEFPQPKESSAPEPKIQKVTSPSESQKKRSWFKRGKKEPETSPPTISKETVDLLRKVKEEKTGF